MEGQDFGWVVNLGALCLILLPVLLLLRGLGQLFERHNVIIVIFYLVFLFPIAAAHALLLGLFGQSKKKRLKQAIKEEVDFQLQVEEERAKR